MVRGDLKTGEKAEKFLRVAAYCRVSTDEQARGETIDTQITEIKKYIKNTYTDPSTKIKWFKDDGVSGTLFFHERDEGSFLFADVIDDKVDVIIVTRVDRLARDDLVAQVNFRTFKEHDIELISLHENFDYRTPTGHLMASTFSSYASYERVVMLNRFADGRATNAAKGKWNGGHIPYGYLREGSKKEGKFILHPEQSQNYTLIKNLALEGMGANQIREKLYDQGILSPTGEQVWAKRTIVYMLRNQFYLGKISYLDISKEDTHPALITQAEYDVIQKGINSRGRKGKNETYHLLSCLIKCSCGHGYTIRYHGKNKVRRYCCSQRYETVNQCPSPLIDAESLEEKIVEIIMGYARQPAALKEAIRVANQYADSQRITIDMKKLANLEKQLAATQKLIRKKDEMYTKGILDDYQYEKEIKSLYDRERELTTDCDAAKTELTLAEKRTGDEKKYIESVTKLEKYWDQFDSMIRQNALRGLISDIQVEDDRLIINFGQFTLPLEPTMSSRGCWWFR